MLFLLAFIDDEKNEEDFIRLYNNYKNYVFKLSYSFLNDHYLAEDCLQEIFIIIAKNFDKIDSIDSKRTKNLIITITKCVSMKIYNKRMSNDELALDKDIDKNAAIKSNVEDEMFNRYTVQALYSAIDGLEEHYKIPLILKDFYSFSCKEISEMLGINKHNVRKRLSRARLKIKEELERQ